MAAKRLSLGRGLGALINDAPNPPPTESSSEPSPGIARIPLKSLRKSPWQPRKAFDSEALAELVASIRERGILQPLLVRKLPEGYELIAGERRMRAATEAGLDEVPVIVMEVSDNEALELALVENLQREDLNIIEEAEGYLLLSQKFGMTQEEVAERVGKARATVANTLRLIALPADVKRLLAEGRISPGHAKALLGVAIEQEQSLLAARVAREGMSVRELEKTVANLRKAPGKPRESRSDIPADQLRHISEQLHERLGTSVRVLPSRTLANGKKAKGCVEIDFYSGDDLERLLIMLGISEDF